MTGGKLLLTGAKGFTGRHFAQAAEVAGYKVYALATNLTDAEAVASEVTKIQPDAVVHLAAISALTHADEAAFYKVNLFGTLNLLNALAGLPKLPRRILIASSANVYGNAAESPIAESLCPRPVNHYAMSKLAMEHMSRTYADRLPLAIVRPFNYTGVGHDERFVIPKLVAHFARHAKLVELGNMEVEREFNDVRTVCDAYLKLLDKGEPGDLYNVCSGNAVSLRLVVDILRDLTGHDIEARVNPAFVRANEVHRLCGSPGLLESRIGALSHPPLEDTLSWMLSSKE